MKHFLLLLLFLLLSACAAPSGFDPALAAQEAENQARMFSAMATGTAQAPIIHITETAAALSFSSTQASINKTSTAVLWTPTITPTPTINVTGTLAVEQMWAEQQRIANEIERDNLAVQREQIKNEFKAKVPVYSFAIISLAAIIILMLIVRQQRYQAAKVDERGNVLPVLDVVEGTYTDVDRSPNYSGVLSHNLLYRWTEQRLQLPKLAPPVTAERQDAVTQRDQLSDMVNRGLPAGPKAESKKQLVQEMAPQLPAPSLETRFKILEDGVNTLDVVDGDIIQVLDHDWKEAEQK